LQALKNILEVFRANNVSASASMMGETILFEVTRYDVPYAQALIDAGATYDISYGCWTYWSNEE